MEPSRRRFPFGLLVCAGTGSLLVAGPALLGASSFPTSAPTCWQQSLAGKNPRLPLRFPLQALTDASPDQQAALLMRGISESTSAPELLSILDQELKNPLFSEAHLALAFNRLAKHEMTLSADLARSPTMRELLAVAHQSLRQPRPEMRAVATLIWSLAGLRGKIPEMEELIPRLVEETVEHAAARDLKDKEVANMIWACSKVRSPKLRQLIPPLVPEVARLAAEFSPQGLSNIVYSATVLRRDVPRLLSVLPEMKEMIVWRADEFAPQAVSNIIWSAVTLRGDAPILLEATPELARAAKKKMDRMKAQDVANLLWAAATMKGSKPPQHLPTLVPPLAARARKITSSFTAQQLANSIWALAKLSTDLETIPVLLDEVPNRAGRMTPQHISNILWAIGQAQLGASTNPKALKALTKRGADVLDNFTPQSLANACWGLALSSIRDPDFMTKVANRVREIIPSIPQRQADLSLPMIACSYARLGMRPAKLLAAIEQRITAMLDVINTWGLCALTWSYRELNADGRFDEFVQKLAQAVERRGIPPGLVERSRVGPETWMRKN